MDIKALLAPAAILVAWSCLMLFWLAFNRFSAVAAMKAQLPPFPPGGRGGEIDPILPNRAKWASHNYTHLMEQPTLFYAVVGILALSGGATQANITAAWGYALLRIVHSIWQALINIVSIRFLLFLASSFCLVFLSVSALRTTLFS
jgi:uncharacterized MAPEG superfamily protein